MIKSFISLILSTVLLVVPILFQNAQGKKDDCAEQITRLEELEKGYESGEIKPVDEAAFFDGDLQKEIDSGMKFNELSFIATHNSYQKDGTEATKQIFRNLSKLTFGLVDETKPLFESETLTQQFNNGIRSIEIDVEAVVKKGKTSFVCMHMPVWGAGTTCYDFALAMKEIYMWSENNPNHLPITIIIEPKKWALPVNGMKSFNAEYAKELDSVLRDTLKEKLFTPADMLRDYASFEEMRLNDDWCKVSDMLGKVLVLLHEGKSTEGYIAADTSIRTQAMFPMLRYGNKDDDNASFLLMNDPDDAVNYSEEIIDRYKLVIRTRADEYLKVSEETREKAVQSRAQIVSTDYPAKAFPTDDVFSFTNGKTIRRISE